ncbi:hypothetical protein Cyast_2509 [Cyanobacterium stanieri PCC 7202]|uniref:Uncharacterized protein n=1 Tax=Cyanobacterium stanieri (strain ATCC 29140 / PCC 7202) TaxID=292563 RepID=K9YPQ9_CYASC|nr:hypothetical protein Cyast_2509 [Cyanobacterium stanieri PCC 7202]
MKKTNLLIYIILDILGIGVILLVFMNFIVNAIQQQYINEAEDFFKSVNSKAINYNNEQFDQYLVNLGLGKVSNQKEDSFQEETDQALVFINAYLEKQLPVKNNFIEPIPEEITLFLEEKNQDINNIINYILQLDSLSWQYDLHEILQDPLSYEIPNFGNIISLQKIFMVHILSESLAGNQAEINRTLEASFRLNQFLQPQPYLIPQLVALITTQHQMRIIRQMTPLTSEWLEKLDNYNYDYSQGVLNALNIEAYSNFSPLLVGETSSFNLIHNFIQKPYTQMMFNDIGSRMLDTFSFFEQESICSVDLNNVSLPSDNIPWWNVLGEIATPNLIDWWLRANWVMLDGELTKNVLRAENVRQIQGGFPESLEGLNSELCDGKSWDYSVSDGQGFFNFEQHYPGNVMMEEGSTIFLPLNFTLKQP